MDGYDTRSRARDCTHATPHRPAPLPRLSGSSFCALEVICQPDDDTGCGLKASGLNLRDVGLRAVGLKAVGLNAAGLKAAGLKTVRPEGRQA